MIDSIKNGLLALGDMYTRPKNSLLQDMYANTAGGAAVGYPALWAQGLRARESMPRKQLDIADSMALASALPVVGDVFGLASDAYKYATQPESRNLLNYGLTALSAIPLIPAMPKPAFIGKSAPVELLNNRQPLNLPDSLAGKVVVSPAQTALLADDMYMKLWRGQDGRYVVSYDPPWGSKSKGFHAFGDDPSTLLNSAVERLGRSDKAVTSAARAKEGKTLLGKLKQEYGDNFELGRSTQSNSQYITHTPTGTKIRVSDHKLPLGYEQPDIDLRQWQSVDEQLAAIKAFMDGR